MGKLRQSDVHLRYRLFFLFFFVQRIYFLVCLSMPLYLPNSTESWCEESLNLEAAFFNLLLYKVNKVGHISKPCFNSVAIDVHAFSSTKKLSISLLLNTGINNFAWTDWYDPRLPQTRAFLVSNFETKKKQKKKKKCIICNAYFHWAIYILMNAVSLWLLQKVIKPVGLGGSVGCAVRLETRRLRVQPPSRSATFFGEIDHEIFSTVILSLPLIQEGQLSVSGERMCTILVNRLED